MRKCVHVLFFRPIETCEILFNQHAQVLFLSDRLDSFYANFVSGCPSCYYVRRNLNKDAVFPKATLGRGHAGGSFQNIMKDIRSAFAKDNLLFNAPSPRELFDFASFQTQSNRVGLEAQFHDSGVYLLNSLPAGNNLSDIHSSFVMSQSRRLWSWPFSRFLFILVLLWLTNTTISKLLCRPAGDRRGGHGSDSAHCLGRQVSSWWHYPRACVWPWRCSWASASACDAHCG